ncbi:MAG: chemotaxis protein CheA [Leptospiraceae bacterium]|nr:chemotaxis protein CheA [Leptospiraceae bacterium]
MNLELAEIKEAFITESSELLQKMETSLLDFERSPQTITDDTINEIFRAVHTIKGNAAVFGFQRIVEFTHGLETVLDEARSGKLNLNLELIEILLESRDQLSELIEAAANETTVTEEQIKVQDSITNRLSKFVKLTSIQTEVPVEPISTKKESNQIRGNLKNQKDGLWHISLRYKKNTFRNGLDPISVLNYLNKIGKIISLHSFLSKSKETGFHPEDCYMSFEFTYSTEKNFEGIQDAFEFIQYDCDIIILPPTRNSYEFVNFLESRTETKRFLLSILLHIGSIDKDDIKEIRRKKNSENRPIEVTKIETSKSIPVTQVTNVEEIVKDKPKEKVEAKSIRIDSSKLDQLINLVGELVISGANLSQLAYTKNEPELLESASHFNRLIGDIRDTSLNLRMVQIGDTFTRYFRVVRDISTELGKDVQLYTSGGDTELDKVLIEKLSDPLTHLVRNALDHGIETKEERIALGKPAKASLYLNAFHEAGNVVIEVRDDGRGIVKEKIISKAIERGLVTEDKRNDLSAQDIYSFMFQAGFSTAEKITNISGRGVGLDVVEKNIKLLRGSIRVDSEEGKGTVLQIRLPLTLAIIDAFVFRVSNSYFAIPLGQVVECLEYQDEFQTDKKDFFNLRGELLSFLRLASFFQIEKTNSRRKNLLVLQYMGNNVGLLVDELLGEQQAVIKPLGKIFQNLKGISGSTILGNGEVALILDLPLLFQKAVGENKSR